MTAYHTTFAAIYSLCLYLVVARGKHLAEDLKGKVLGKCVTEEDLRAWGGFVPRAINWIAEERHNRKKWYFKFGGWFGWAVDFVTTPFML